VRLQLGPPARRHSSKDVSLTPTHSGHEAGPRTSSPQSDGFKPLNYNERAAVRVWGVGGCWAEQAAAAVVFPLSDVTLTPSSTWAEAARRDAQYLTRLDNNRLLCLHTAAANLTGNFSAPTCSPYGHPQVNLSRAVSPPQFRNAFGGQG